MERLEESIGRLLVSLSLFLSIHLSSLMGEVKGNTWADCVVRSWKMRSFAG